MRHLIILLAITVLPLASALSPWEVELMDATVTMSGGVNVDHTSGDSNINWIEASLYIYPQDTNLQSAKLLSVTPDTYSIETDRFGNKILKITWERPRAKVLDYEVKWDVSVNRFKNAIMGLGGIADTNPGSLEEYLQPDNLTAWTGAMKNKAKSIAEGSGSRLAALASMSNWIYNTMEYDKDYWSSSVPASDVFTIRRGVCDEYTNLLISFAKSLGIPGRYVEGLVFSGENWDLHAWAEFYVDGVWLPIDPTYNEVGFVDSTHIVLARVPSDDHVFNRLRWEGRGVEAYFGPDSKEVFVTKTESKLNILDVNLRLSRESVGSNALLEAEASVENLANNSYIVATCRLNMPLEMVQLDNLEKSSVIPPSGETVMKWRILSPSTLDYNYVYNMPIQVVCFPKAASNESLIISPRTVEEGVPDARFEDVVIFNQSSAQVVLVNEGSKEIRSLEVLLCIENGESNCTKEIVRDLKIGEKRAILFSGLNLTEDKKLLISLSSDELDAAHAITANTSSIGEQIVISRSETGSGLQNQGLHDREPLQRIKNELILLVVTIAIILIILVSMFKSTVKHH
ncbi:MAG: transglutaminase family protein [Candidatus Altiarchaeota archaeon]|nr:transglutaminase family protein [Candidatus Altiarchaeota archaeon]